VSGDNKKEGKIMEKSGEIRKYPEEETYNKLVRDRIPEIIMTDGSNAETKLLKPEEIIDHLKKKTIEEAQELVEAVEIDDVKKEIADLEEVLKSLRERLKISEEEIEEIRLARAKSRGRFEKGIYLIRTYKE
jgi:predicted house-cleaning noncanonical NTP pyrophosphatase (MazG superfamily)